MMDEHNNNGRAAAAPPAAATTTTTTTTTTISFQTSTASKKNLKHGRGNKRKRVVTSFGASAASDDDQDDEEDGNEEEGREQKVMAMRADGTFVTDTSEADARAAKKKKALPVIPMIDGWAHVVKTGQDNNNNDSNSSETAKDESLDDKAARALLRDVAGASNGDADEEDDMNGGVKPTIALKDSTTTTTTRDSVEAPMLIRNMVPGLSELKDAKEKFKHDLSMRPDALEAKPESYSVAIEDFGAAMLRGMNWNPAKGVGVGKNCRVVKPLDIQARPSGLGLGATAKPDQLQRKRGNKQGQNSATSGNSSSMFGWLDIGVLVRITQGDHENEYGVVAKVDGVPGLDNILVQLSRGIGDGDEDDDNDNDGGGGEGVGNAKSRLLEAPVRRSAVELVDPKSLPPSHVARALLKESMAQREADLRQADERARQRELADARAEHNAYANDSKSSTKSSKTSKDKKHKKKHKRKDKDHRERKRETCWLTAGIRVRLVSKSFGGSLYTRKGVVQVVTGDDSRERGPRCVLAMDGEGQVLEDVSQRQVETALPKPGGRVMVLRGEHIGSVGKLLGRDSHADRAVVQLFGDLSVTTCSFDDVAEYCFDDHEGADH